ncbi:MAG: transporter substrate-binding domain-containing protein [Chloroflexota bacterium]
MVRKLSPQWAALLALVTLFLLSSSLIVADPQLQTAPTLVPPTLVATMPPASADALLSESGVARIIREGKVRVGMLFNEPPFGQFSIRGEESGFDADLARAMAEAWSVQVEFQQVTRQTGIDMVTAGSIDLLIAAQPHLRELDERVEFSQSYYPSVEAMVVRQGDGATVLGHMEGRKVGVVIGTNGERAVDYWKSYATYPFEVLRFLTLDLAIGALNNSEIDGVVDNRVRLSRVINSEIQRFVDVPIMPEPYAIAMSRQDVNLRNLVNKTLQYLYATGRLNEIHQSNFDDAAYPGSAFVVWSNVGEDAPKPDQFGQDVPFPSQYVIPRMQAERTVRVAGLVDLPADAPESQKRLDAVNRALINALAQRWQVTVVPVSVEGQTPVDLVASGAADFAVGVQPDWNAASQVDFSSYYLMHGLRLMVRTADDYTGFADLRGRIIGIFQDDAGAREAVTAQAAQASAVIDDFFTVLREQDAAFTLLVDNNATVMFGDSLKLIPNVEANPNDLHLTTNEDGSGIWYSRQFIGMALPRNDINARLLVEYTLQELTRDGTLATILQPVMNPQDMPVLDIWPGATNYLGFNLTNNAG